MAPEKEGPEAKNAQGPSFLCNILLANENKNTLIFYHKTGSSRRSCLYQKNKK